MKIMATKKKTAEKPAEDTKKVKAEEAPAVEAIKTEELPAEPEKKKIAPAQIEAPRRVKVVTANDGTPRFTRKQLLASKRYIDNRDALYAVLDDKATYTLEEVDKALSAF